MFWLVLALNCIAFILFASDKQKAKKHHYRIAEKTLLLALLLGGVGGYGAMFICHHKTRKWYFHAVGILGVVLAIFLLQSSIK